MYELHRQRGVLFKRFLDWELPAEFNGFQRECFAAHNTISLFDCSYVGRFKITGSDALDLLNRLSTNKVDTLLPGQTTTTIFTNEKGRIIDAVGIGNLGNLQLMLTSPQTPNLIKDWIDRFTFAEDLELEDITHSTAMFRVFGPDSSALIHGLFGLDTLEKDNITLHSQGKSKFQIFRSNSFGIQGFTIVATCESASGLYTALLDAGIPWGIEPMGITAYQFLRVEAGYPQYNKEIGEDFNPLEAGLGHYVDFTKGCYIGQEVIARLDSYNKVKRQLVTVDLPLNSEIREGTKLWLDGRQIGFITSISKHPWDRHLLGLAYLNSSTIEPGLIISTESGLDQIKVKERAWIEDNIVSPQ